MPCFPAQSHHHVGGGVGPVLARTLPVGSSARQFPTCAREAVRGAFRRCRLAWFRGWEHILCRSEVLDLFFLACKSFLKHDHLRRELTLVP